MFYDPSQVVSTMYEHNLLVFICMLGNIVPAFLYFAIGVYMTHKQKIYVLPFTGAALFFWHDLNYVLDYELWFSTYEHWWFKFTWFALVGTVVFEVYLISQFIKFGHAELFPEMDKKHFTLLTIGATMGVGCIWFLIKGSLHDDLFLIGFALTAIFSVPFHTGIMLRRRSSAGQSVVMEICVMILFTAVSVFFITVAPVTFKTPTYFAFFVVFNLWCVVNIILIKKLPDSPAYPNLTPIKGWVG